MKPIETITDSELIEACILGYPAAFQEVEKNLWDVERDFEDGNFKVHSLPSHYVFYMELEFEEDELFEVVDLDDDERQLDFNKEVAEKYLRSIGYDI